MPTEEAPSLPDWLDNVQSPQERCENLMSRLRQQVRHLWGQLDAESVEARTGRAAELGVGMRELMEGDPSEVRLFDLVVAFGLVNEGVSVRHHALRTEEGSDAVR